MKRLILILLVLISVSCQAQFYVLNRNYGEVVKYGYLYNWYAVDLSAGDTIANDGWHVPTLAEQDILRLFIDPIGGVSDNDAGGFMKETGLVYWDTPNTGATNGTLFNGRGSGTRDANGVFGTINERSDIWAYDEFSATLGKGGSLFSNSDVFYTGFFPDKKIGYSVRLIKNSTTLSDGETGTYTGNDGAVYRTICIGTQEWLADNLAETKYRNGDWITGYDGGVYTPISDVNWAAKTTEAMCAYNDDLNNVFE